MPKWAYFLQVFFAENLGREGRERPWIRGSETPWGLGDIGGPVKFCDFLATVMAFCNERGGECLTGEPVIGLYRVTARRRRGDVSGVFPTGGGFGASAGEQIDGNLLGEQNAT